MILDKGQKYIYLGEKLCVHKLCNLFCPQPVFGLPEKSLLATNEIGEYLYVRQTCDTKWRRCFKREDWSPDLINLRQSWSGRRWGSGGLHPPLLPLRMLFIKLMTILKEECVQILLTPPATIFSISGSILRRRIQNIRWKWNSEIIVLCGKTKLKQWVVQASYLRWCARSVERMLSLVGKGSLVGWFVGKSCLVSWLVKVG